MEREHWIPASEWPQLIDEIGSMHAEMEEPARSRLDEGDLEHLRILIRITIEFRHYVRSKVSRTSERDEFTKNYVCETILGGIDSLRHLSFRYQSLIEAIPSNIGWKDVSELSFYGAFVNMFEEFVGETSFEKKFRLLLDLFKLQIVFAGVSYYAAPSAHHVHTK